jgi:preprotein translocase subunit SecE
MVSGVDSQKSKLDVLLWGVALTLAVCGIGGNYYFSFQSLLLRVVALIIIGMVICAVLYKTTIGKKAWDAWNEAITEVRRVIWPTKKETTQMTLAVLAMVFIMGLFLWSIDALLIRLVEWVLGHNGV